MPSITEYNSQATSWSEVSHKIWGSHRQYQKWHTNCSNALYTDFTHKRLQRCKPKTGKHV